MNVSRGLSGCGSSESHKENGNKMNMNIAALPLTSSESHKENGNLLYLRVSWLLAIRESHKENGNCQAEIISGNIDVRLFFRL